MSKYEILQLSTLIFLLISCANRNSLGKSKTTTGAIDCLPDSITAVNHGKELLTQKFGRNILKNGPVKAVLINDSTWNVSISTEYLREKEKSQIFFGGGKAVVINKRDCKIIEFYENE
jgi:hypothetical protein